MRNYASASVEIIDNLNAASRQADAMNLRLNARQRLAGARCSCWFKGQTFDGVDLSSISMNHLRFERCSLIEADLRHVVNEVVVAVRRELRQRSDAWAPLVVH